MPHAVHGKEGEVQDIPFVGNDMKDHTPTMDNSLDAHDATGRADSEMVKETVAESDVSA
jgi:hypothetical protein